MKWLKDKVWVLVLGLGVIALVVWLRVKGDAKSARQLGVVLQRLKARHESLAERAEEMDGYTSSSARRERELAAEHAEAIRVLEEQYLGREKAMQQDAERIVRELESVRSASDFGHFSYGGRDE